MMALAVFSLADSRMRPMVCRETFISSAASWWCILSRSQSRKASYSSIVKRIASSPADSSHFGPKHLSAGGLWIRLVHLGLAIVASITIMSICSKIVKALRDFFSKTDEGEFDHCFTVLLRVFSPLSKQGTDHAEQW